MIDVTNTMSKLVLTTLAATATIQRIEIPDEQRIDIESAQRLSINIKVSSNQRKQ
ncbi:hypothetical protein [Photobacterium phosphoreum]|uniref:hypothetical protein n=1 Tax=Photobacterium phosphoreum TaxID=659 RepID=UPI0015E77FF9|nr:hypothetical protein [Photobacterium phosphoreum]MCD9481478.1 hypothetical protein [Photobacterium phosphoreum]